MIILKHILIVIVVTALVMSRAVHRDLPSITDGYKFWKTIWKDYKFPLGFALFNGIGLVLLGHLVPGVEKIMGVLVEVKDDFATDLGVAAIAMSCASYFFLNLSDTAKEVEEIKDNLVVHDQDLDNQKGNYFKE